jgi:hypothetical protein
LVDKLTGNNNHNLEDSTHLEQLKARLEGAKSNPELGDATFQFCDFFI